MDTAVDKTAEIEVFGIGSYTATEAARLLRTRVRSINRWMAGYTYSVRGEPRTMPPLWLSQVPGFDGKVEIGFRDLIELRFVKAFVDAGVGLKAVRNCLDYARALVQDHRPFATRRFQTDGKTIFLESIDQSGETSLLDLKQHQYVLRKIIERTFRDLDIEDDVVTRWRPFNGKESIVVDPTRAFGQPIAAEYGVPTSVLADAAQVEGSIERTARLFEVPHVVVRDAARFEKQLRAA